MDVPPVALPKRGRGPMIWAVAAVLATGCCVLILPSVLLPAIAQAKQQKAATECKSYIRQVGEVMGLYAADYDDHLPPAGWMDASELQMPREKFLHCPGVGTDAYGYALNEELVGRSRSEIKDGSSPMVFDSTLTGRNAVGSLGTLPQPGRHLKTNHVATLDGSVVVIPD